MPQSLASVYVHVIFSTKGRSPLLKHAQIREELHAYIGGISKRLDCLPVAIGGAEDHVHVLARFGKEVTIAGWIKELKRASSIFARERIEGFSWQAGYAAFSVGPMGLEGVETYIRAQMEHHEARDYQSELRQLMQEHGMEWDERYFWD